MNDKEPSVVDLWFLTNLFFIGMFALLTIGSVASLLNQIQLRERIEALESKVGVEK